mmetsp:Transcript_125737/g.242299  ORF Transcript_125737/g.242299 Transcript_125737/m.242299 type:complete len:202 (-) Transcript_125737:2187-2792(-)
MMMLPSRYEGFHHHPSFACVELDVCDDFALGAACAAFCFAAAFLAGPAARFTFAAVATMFKPYPAFDAGVGEGRPHTGSGEGETAGTGEGESAGSLLASLAGSSAVADSKLFAEASRSGCCSGAGPSLLSPFSSLLSSLSLPFFLSLSCLPGPRPGSWPYCFLTSTMLSGVWVVASSCSVGGPSPGILSAWSNASDASCSF